MGWSPLSGLYCYCSLYITRCWQPVAEVSSARRVSAGADPIRPPGCGYIPGIPGVEAFELKNRKKLDPTSTARPAASAASIALEEVMPLLPSGVGQSFGSLIRTGLTSHQI